MNYTDFSEDERKFYLSESGFDSREKEFFRLRVYEEKTLFETAEIMGYSPRTIDRINRKVKKKIVKVAPMYYRGFSLYHGENMAKQCRSNTQVSLIECVLNRIDNMIDTLNVDRYIVIGNISEEENPVANENAVKLNKLQSEKYGSHFIDAKYLLINYGLQSMGITPTEQDKTDIADNRVPTSLRSDNIHLNAKGYSYISKIVYQKGASLKYWYN